MEKYFDEIIAHLQPLFDEHGFKKNDNAQGVYLNDKTAVRIKYDESRTMFTLETAAIADGESVNFAEISGWLFDGDHDSKDAAVIAEDFQNNIKAELGIKTEGMITSREVRLPEKNTAGTVPGVEALARRFMDIFPQYKDTYKADMEKYGEFMYHNFFKNTAAVKLRELSSDPKSNKKHLVKLLTLLNEMYAEGDTNVSNTIAYTIIGGAFRGDTTLFDSITEHYDDLPYIKQNGRVMIEMLAKNSALHAGFND